MSQSFESWSKATGSIFKGILLYCIANVLYPIFDGVASLQSIGSGLASFASGGSVGDVLGGGPSALDIICWVLLAGIIIGVVLYVKGLGQFRQILEATDNTAVGKVRTGALLLIIAAAVDFIPFLGWVGGILSIIAYILMLIGFSTLKKSETFPEAAKKGASLLFVAALLVVIGMGVGFIPFIGTVVEMIVCPIAFILMIVGWARVKGAVTA